MTRIVQEHDFQNKNGLPVCVYCHVPELNVVRAGPEKPITCISRWIEGAEPRETRMHRGMAADDFDTIGARLAELRKEQDEALARTVDEQENTEAVAWLNNEMQKLLLNPRSTRYCDKHATVYWANEECNHCEILHAGVFGPKVITDNYGNRIEIHSDGSIMVSSNLITG